MPTAPGAGRKGSDDFLGKAMSRRHRRRHRRCKYGCCNDLGGFSEGAGGIDRAGLLTPRNEGDGESRHVARLDVAIG
jgi:hypothetical protein